MKAWESYFALTGTAAVTLMGLLFVVITLKADRAERGDEGSCDEPSLQLRPFTPASHS